MDPILEQIFKKYPALRNLGKVTLKADPNFTTTKTGLGDIEYFSPTQDTIRYDGGFNYGHPALGSHGVVYNPSTNDEQSIMLDLLHGLSGADKTYSAKRNQFGKALLGSKFGSDFENEWKTFDKETAGNNDGKEQFKNNWIDGQIRALMFQGTDEEFTKHRYFKGEREQKFTDPNIKNTFTELQNYLSTGKYPEGGPAFNENWKQYFANQRGFPNGGPVPKKPLPGISLPEVNIYGHRDKETQKIIDSLTSKDNESSFDKAYYDALWQLQFETGNPNIRTWDSAFIPLANRSYYNPLTNTMTLRSGHVTSSEGVTQEDIDQYKRSRLREEYIQELSHSKQFMGGSIDKIKKIVKGFKEAIKDVGSGERYHVPGTIENEAHSQISPILEDRLQYLYNQSFDKLYPPSKNQNGGPVNPFRLGFDLATDRQFLRRPTSSATQNFVMSPDYRRFFDVLAVKDLQTGVGNGLDFLTNWFSGRKGFGRAKTEALEAIQNPEITVRNMSPDLGGYFSRGESLDGKPYGVNISSDLIGAKYGDVMSTTLHELNHKAQFESPAIQNNVDKLAKYVGARPEIKEWQRDNLEYLQRPEELHSRMMEFREIFGIDPRDKFNGKTLKAIKNYTDQLPDSSPEKSIFNSIYNVIPVDKDFIKIMNKIVDVGAKQPTNNARQGGFQYQYGGQVNPFNFVLPTSYLTPDFGQQGLNSYFSDPAMLPKADLGGFFRGIGKGIGKIGKAVVKGFGAGADQTLSFFGAPNVIQNSGYDQNVPQWLKGLNSGVGSLAGSVLGGAIPGAGLGIAALQGLGNRSQGTSGGFDFGSLMGGGQSIQPFSSGSMLSGLQSNPFGQFGGTPPFVGGQQQFGTQLGQLFANLQGQGGFGGIFGGQNLQPRTFEEGGQVESQAPQMVPVQTEVGENFIHIDGAVTPTNATETHERMEDDEVTDIIPEGTYVASNDKKIKMTFKQAEEIVMGLKALPYEEFKKGKIPEKILFSKIFGKEKKLTPAELTTRIIKMFPTVDKSTTFTKNDVFTEITNQENIETRLPWLEQVIQFNEERRTGNAPAQFKKGGQVLRMKDVQHLPKGGVAKHDVGDWVSTAATALPFLKDLFGGNKNSQVDPLARNLILGSAPLYNAGLTANINAQQNALGTAITDFTGLGQNLNQFAGATAFSNILGRQLQNTNFQRFDPSQQDSRLANFNTRTPNSFVDALSTPKYDLNSLAATLGPRGFNTFAGQLAGQTIDSRNNAMINQFNQNRGLDLNILGQRNSLDSFSQQFNIGQAEKQQQAENAQTAGTFGDISSYFNRLGDIQSQILPITTGFNMQRAGLTGQAQMGSAQNALNVGSIYAGLAGNPQQQQPAQQPVQNYQFLKNILGNQVQQIGQDRATTNRNEFNMYNPYQYPQQLSTLPAFVPRNSWDSYGG